MKSFKRFAYKISTFTKDEQNPPTVDDNSAEYLSGIFTFNASHFTNNFQDPDGDSYRLTRIKTLPPVGDLKYESNSIEEGFIFNLGNVGNLTYELPNNYMVSSTGYCVFDEPINTIITNEETNGYNLTYLGDGRLEFQRVTNTTIPNDTDIYAFFDATSMKIEDAQAAQSALIEWYDLYKATNTLFTGNLYILPIVKEDWLDFPNIIWRGSSNRVRNNSDRPNDDFMALAILPANFDTTSNNENLTWIPPTKIVTLAFIDEAADGTEAYHKNRNGYGFDGQPTSQYFTDYKNFKENYENNFQFFKGIFYPIPDIDAGNYNNIYNACVLQGFAAIEGGATYTLQEIEGLGVTFAQERRFHWHLDPTHPYYSGDSPTVANPYSSEAQTPVPNTNYYLQGLNDFGWVGVYDKDQPASAVFSSDTFNSDLNKYLEGEVIQNIETKVIEGDCSSINNEICFDFDTSDDSKYVLFSNVATFCLTGTTDPNNTMEANAPTVDNYNISYDQNLYTFSITPFINNFTDPDGDSYQFIKLNSGVKSSSGFNIGGLTLLGSTFSYPQIIDSANIGNLAFDLPSEYEVFNNRVYKYNGTLSTLITNLESQGYTLMDNTGSLEFYKIDTTNSESPTVDTQTIEGNDIGNKSIKLDFRISDNSSYNLYSNLATIYLNMENTNTPPTVVGTSDVVSSNEFVFDITNFNTSFTDTEGNTLKSISVSSDIDGLGELRYNGALIQAPFAIDSSNISNLKYTVPNRFVFVGSEIFSFDESYDDIVTNYTNQGYTLTSNQGGILTFTKTTTEVEIAYEYGKEVTTQEYCMDFKVSDNGSIPLFSEVAQFCLTVPQSEVVVTYNQPPIVGDIGIDLDPRQTFTLTASHFTTNTTPAYSDPEGDTYENLLIAELPLEGEIQLSGVAVSLGDVISFDDIELGNLTYVPNALNTASYSDVFKFKVSDVGSQRYSNTGFFTITVAQDKAIPTVADNSAPLSSKTYTFTEASFTTNFADVDGDSYKYVKIKSLPQVSKLTLLGNDVSVGDTFLAVNSSGLKFTLADRYAIYSGVIYDFGSSLDSIIQGYTALGYRLTDNTTGVLTFTNENDGTDIIKVQGIILDNSALCFNFATSDDSTFELYSSDAQFCLIPQGDINVKSVYVNLPPTIGDNRISTKYNEAKLLSKNIFVEDTHPSYSDPEGDDPWYLKVLTLPTNGTLELNGVAVTVNQEIAFSDIIAGLFYYIPDSTRTDIANVEFDFTIKDTGSNTYA